MTIHDFARRGLSHLTVAIAAGALVGAGVGTGGLAPASAYEVWLTDQSDTGKESGGFLYIYDGAALAANPAAAKPAVTIDLSGEINTFCEAATKKPVRRPHMLFFNKNQDHAIISFLSGHVLFMDAKTRKPEACLSMGKNVHAAWPTPDQKMAIAANIAEKKFIRIWPDYAAHKFNFDPEKDVVDLIAWEGGERPDTSPICPITESSSHYAFVTLRGGGLLVFDVTTTPMKIVATLDNNQIHPAGCAVLRSTGRCLSIPVADGRWRPSRMMCTPSIYPIFRNRSQLNRCLNGMIGLPIPTGWPRLDAISGVRIGPGTMSKSLIRSQI